MKKNGKSLKYAFLFLEIIFKCIRTVVFLKTQNKQTHTVTLTKSIALCFVLQEEPD